MEKICGQSESPNSATGEWNLQLLFTNWWNRPSAGMQELANSLLIISILYQMLKSQETSQPPHITDSMYTLR